MQIKEMQAADLADVLEIIASHSEWDATYCQPYYTEYFATEMSPLERNYVAWSDAGEIIGVCGYSPDKYRTPNILWLTWFYVRQDYVGTLAGYYLFRQVEEQARKTNARKLYLDTGNEPVYANARRFYQSAGFEVEGELIDYYGSGEHMIVMGKALS